MTKLFFIYQNTKYHFFFVISALYQAISSFVPGMREPLSINNRSALFLLIPVFSSFFSILCLSLPSHPMVPKCDAIMALHFASLHPLCIVHSISILYLIIVQMNAEPWFQLSPLFNIIRTRLPGLSYSSPFSSINRNILFRLRIHTLHSSRMCH